MSVSQIGTVLDSIRAGLVERAGLAGVNVFSGPVSLEEAGLEAIEHEDATLVSNEPFAMDGSILETWDVRGGLVGWASWQGDTETTIEAARDRALEMFGEVESYINDTYASGAYPYVAIAAGGYSWVGNPEHRGCILDYTLRVQAVKNP